jgi:tetratricopeptide (TPR) repeat protein
MPSVWKRLFSSTYRKALGAEAAGDYLAAAESYALADMPVKVAEMHLVRAQRAEPSQRVAALKDAVRWLRRVEVEARPSEIAEDLAKAFLEEAKMLPAGDPRRRELATEAAGLYETIGKAHEAGESYELVGEKERAARSYEAAGDIEGMERLLEEDASSREATQSASTSFDEFEAAMAAGARDVALAALRRCCANAPGQGYERMLEDLERKLPPPGTVELRLDGVRMVLAGAAPTYIGRGDAHIPLRHPGISRRHVAIDIDATGFALRDAGSRNGTSLGGIDVAGRVPLEGSGVIGLGAECTIQFTASPGALELEVLDGPDRGLRAVVIRRPWSPERSSFTFAFRDGLARVESNPAGALVLNGARTSSPIVLVMGDVVESPGGGRIDVV